MQWKFEGETLKYPNFMDRSHYFLLSKKMNALKIEATEDLFLRECELSLVGNQRRIEKMSYLKKGQVYIFHFQLPTYVNSITCLGKSIGANFKLGALKIYSGLGFTPIPVPRPLPGPAPAPIPVPGPVPGPAPAPLPRVVNLPDVEKEICVGKSKKMIQLSIQARWWKVNGMGSQLSTWRYPGSKASLTLDYATANVHAYCKKPGKESFNVTWMLAFTDPNIYQKDVVVKCVTCSKPEIEKIKKRVNLALDLFQRNKIEIALRELDRALRELNKLEEQGEFTPEQLELIETEIRDAFEQMRMALLEQYEVKKAYERLIQLLNLL